MRAPTTPALLLALATFGATLTGCADGAPTAAARHEPTRARTPAPPEGTGAGRVGAGSPALEPRPLAGVCETAFGLPLSPPPVLLQEDRGTCQLSHLGRTAVYILQDIDIVAGTQVSRRFTLTAANGDVLLAENAGTFAPARGGTGSVFTSTMTFVGGTGRFAHATGQAHLAGTVDFRTSTAAFTVVDGWITYDASDRSGR
jgi:hypothetical protein